MVEPVSSNTLLYNGSDADLIERKSFLAQKIQRIAIHCWALFESVFPLFPFLSKLSQVFLRIPQADVIAGKLNKQLGYGKKQACDQLDCFQFRYRQCKNNSYIENFSKIHSETLYVLNHEVGICHFIGRRPSMEDEHLATAFQLKVSEKIYPVQLYGIFDGHGGNEAAIFVRDHLQKSLHESLSKYCGRSLSDGAIWEALKKSFERLNVEFAMNKSGTTATVAMILDDKLWTANVGDSRTILDNGLQLTEDAKPQDPRYRRGIEKRGGVVIGGRINERLAVARAIGDHDVGAVNPRPKITVIPLSEIPPESHLILACDGIYDVASTRQVAEAIQTHKNRALEMLAKDIVYSAYRAGSQDNLSIMVINPNNKVVPLSELFN